MIAIRDEMHMNIFLIYLRFRRAATKNPNGIEITNTRTQSVNIWL